MDIVVKGRHTEVAERFRGHAEEKLAKIGKKEPAKPKQEEPKADGQSNGQ